MNLTGLLSQITRADQVREVISAAPQRGILDVVAPVGIRAPLIAQIANEVQARGNGDAKPGMFVVVTATGREAQDFADALSCYLPADDVAVLPAWETLPHERLSPRSDTVARRLAVFRRLAHPELEPETAHAGRGAIKVLLVPVRSLLQPVVTGLGELVPVTVGTGDIVDLEQLSHDLTAAAYQRVDMVERRGEFAVRGGIVDVFPPTESHPLRIELWGDEVDEIRRFSVADQRSLEIAEEGVWAPPCREMLLTPQVRQRAHDLIAELPGAADMLEKLANGIAVEGMESLAPVLVDEMVPMLDLVPDDALLVVSEPERVRRRAHDLVSTTEEFLAAAWTSAAAGAAMPVALSSASFETLEDTQSLALRKGIGWWSLGVFGDDLADDLVTLPARDVHGYRGDINAAVTDLQNLAREGWRLLVATDGPGPGRRMVEQLSAADVPARFVGEITEVPQPGVVLVTSAVCGDGFVMPDLNLALLTERDFTGRAGTGTKDMRKMPAARRRNAVDPLELRPGDYVVHDQHGVGRFIELVERTIGAGAAAAKREYLVIEYASSKRSNKGQQGDRLFVPMDQLDQVTKYTGGESPTVNKMGGSDWARTKGRARKAIKEIAGELIQLYSARMATRGHKFGPDTPWQRELEDAFPYVETPDQLVTIDEVKADMEKEFPMDRLVCGDVGYGKTEIAVRAAFKAVQDGKQVAVLVPTTLLVQQHHETFSERYSGFPVNVASLSRFATDKEAKEVRDGVAKGTIDVVIGTHRILSGEVKFKDLGLVIIDEEQRFGVEHKEALKKLRTNVDVLAMSATPIPRTLEMAVTGIREMSTLATPPEERHPVLTFVGPYQEKQIVAAVRRELLRDGQLFYVHNRVESIDATAARLQELVPEARIGVAHGKMGEGPLERAVLGFWEKEFDVLVCTTIVETGLDISNANTLIVERADRFGLSQLYQLRGRVGRGRERAYAYFLYPPERPRTETAHEWLTTIASQTELGAGMAVAMKDLEIRGAGNLLGGEQSGHIAGVGFDLYVRMVSEAVATFRGEADEQPPEVKVELPVDAHIPHDYIDHERLRLEAYKRIADAATAEELQEVSEELVDRYGALPEPVEVLFAAARFRNQVREVGVREITAQGSMIRFAPVDLPESAQLRLKRLYPKSIYKSQLDTVLVPRPTTARVGGKPLRDREILDWAHKFVQAIVVGDIASAAEVAQ